MSKTKDIREAVESELRHDPLVDAAGITVKNMNGMTNSSGSPDRLPRDLRALRCWWLIHLRSAGLRRHASH